MDASETCEYLLSLVKKSNLNFSLSESPFAVTLNIKKTFIKDLRGVSRTSKISQTNSRLGNQLTPTYFPPLIKSNSTPLFPTVTNKATWSPMAQYKEGSHLLKTDNNNFLNLKNLKDKFSLSPPPTTRTPQEKAPRGSPTRSSLTSSPLSSLPQKTSNNCTFTPTPCPTVAPHPSSTP